MIRQICPVCDQVMTVPHYCSVCRSFVKKPWEYDITYYLNERHPENETGCSYHEPMETGTSGETIWNSVPTKQTIQKRMAEHAARRDQVKPNVPRKMNGTQNKAGVSKMIAVIVTVYVIFQLILVMFNMLIDRLFW